MKAMILSRPGARAVEPADCPVPTPGRGDVLVRVRACGVCRTDLHIVDGELPDPKIPIVPGHEIIGVVERVGADVVDLAPERASESRGSATRAASASTAAPGAR